MNRDKKGRFAGKTKWGFIFLVSITVASIIVVNYDVEKERFEAPEVITKVLTGIEEIANRPEIKKQQELIVKEQYIKEEKARTLEEKKKVIAEFDLKLQSYELELEGIRKEKIVF